MRSCALLLNPSIKINVDVLNLIQKPNLKQRNISRRNVNIIDPTKLLSTNAQLINQRHYTNHSERDNM